MKQLNQKAFLNMPFLKPQLTVYQQVDQQPHQSLQQLPQQQLLNSNFGVVSSSLSFGPSTESVSPSPSFQGNNNVVYGQKRNALNHHISYSGDTAESRTDPTLDFLLHDLIPQQVTSINSGRSQKSLRCVLMNFCSVINNIKSEEKN